MKLAFLILAHNYPLHLARLVNKLAHPNNTFFIHIDAKSDIELFQNQQYDNAANLIWIKERENIQWGSFEMVQATINLLKEAKENNISFDHYILLSGVDFPIKSTDNIRAFFEENKKKSFIEYQPFPVESLNHGGLDRTEHYTISFGGKRETYLPKEWVKDYSIKGKIFNFLLGLMLKGKPKRRFPFNWKAYYGSQWWSLSDEAASFILLFLENHPDYIEYHQYSLIPDEMFFQSILKNEYPHQENIINDNLRLIEFEENSSHPRVFEEKDLEKLVSSEKLFARKFEEDSKITTEIEKKLC